MASDLAKVGVASQMTPYVPEAVTAFATLIEVFLQKRMSVLEFESAYLRAFKDDATDWPEPIYAILNDVFLDVDAYYPDPAIRGAFEIDEAELRSRVERSLSALRRLR